MELKIKKVDNSHEDFQLLVAELDKDLAVYDGNEHAFYDQYNKVTMIKYALVGYVDHAAMACGAIKEWDEKTMEVKRMFVRHDSRGRGFSKSILAALEEWARELNYERCILETGKRQVEAVGLYYAAQYKVMENYGQYVGVENSLCFEKMLG